MKEWKINLTPSKEKSSVSAARKKEDISLNKIKTVGDRSQKKGEKGDEIMAYEEELKVFIREQEKFNKRFGDFVEGLSKSKEQEVEKTRIKEEVKTATIPMEEKIEQFGTVLQKLQKQLEPFGEVCTTVEECEQKIKELQKAPSEEESKEKTLDKFSAQEKYDSIKTAPSALADLDSIYVGRFSEDPEYRKLALEKLPDEVFVELAKKKAIESKLTALCKDDVCRTDVVKKIKAVEKSTGKKLL